MEVMIKELGTIITGNTPSKKNGEFWNSEDICFVKPDIISDNGVNKIFESNEYISKEAKKKAKVVSKDSIFITCIGSIGKIGIALEGEYAFNQQINAIVPNDKVVPKYLAYNLLYNKPRLVSIANAPVVPIINKKQFGDFTINIDSNKNKQLKVVDVLDKLTHVIEQRNDELSALNDLIKARFVEMFGDMYLNSKGWSETKLESMADVVSGITKGRKTRNEDLTEVPYMAVSNVKDGYIDWTTVKTIEATQQEITQYRLLPNDVLMTEGGDPDKVGRGAIIKEPLENCIHQNHIFRVRLDESVILPEFFAEYLQHQRSKRYFLRCAKQTTGIASINMKQLRALPVLVPPLSEQEGFVLFKEQIDKSKVAVQKALDETQILFDSLMQKYFG